VSAAQIVDVESSTYELYLLHVVDVVVHIILHIPYIYYISLIDVEAAAHMCSSITLKYVCNSVGYVVDVDYMCSSICSRRRLYVQQHTLKYVCNSAYIITCSCSSLY
jgi:hypothetical protein